VLHIPEKKMGMPLLNGNANLGPATLKKKKKKTLDFEEMHLV